MLAQILELVHKNEVLVELVVADELNQHLEKAALSVDEIVPTLSFVFCTANTSLEADVVCHRIEA